MDLESIYTQLCRNPSDINEHLPTLKKYSEQCDHVTEFGVRNGASTHAILMGKPKKFISYDLKSCPVISQIQQYAKETATDFKFIESNVLTVSIEHTDLLFIDTLGTYNQLSQELNRHSKNVNKFIIIHDTVVYGNKDEYPSTGKGLKPAIQEFIKYNPQWKILREYLNNHGLIILGINNNIPNVKSHNTIANDTNVINITNDNNDNINSNYNIKKVISNPEINFGYTLEKLNISDALTRLYNNNINPEYGVNLCALFSTSKGISEAPRQMGNAIDSVKIPLIKIEESTKNAPNPYFFNLLSCNADQTPRVANNFGKEFFKHKYAIGYWFWELLKFPTEWNNSFDYIDELWVASDFCLDLFKRISPNKPVIKIPVPIIAPSDSTIITATKNDLINRKRYNIDNDCFIFLFIFDCHSIFERKNPMAIVEAFEKAFGKDNKKVKLIIKASYLESDFNNRQRLQNATINKSIMLIDKIIAKEEITNLMHMCNCYVSLHRSEGYGLTMAEAMAIGKPVIATNFSGNLTFMNKDNSYLVDYKLKELENSISVYKKGSHWADPNIDTAVELMRLVYCNQSHAIETGLRARKHIEDNFNHTVIGNMIDKRLKTILSVQQ